MAESIEGKFERLGDIRDKYPPSTLLLRGQYVLNLQNKIKELKENIAHLEEKLRWRKFSEEKPSEEMEGEDFLVSNGYYSVVCEWRGYWDNDPFCGDKNCDVVKFWMPLPLAPKEAK